MHLTGSVPVVKLRIRDTFFLISLHLDLLTKFASTHLYHSLFPGKYHYVSEDTHWAPFVKASVEYIRANYPQPWDEVYLIRSL